MFLNLFNKLNILNLLVFIYLVSYIAGPAIINIYVTIISLCGVFYLYKNKSHIFLIFKDSSTIIFSLFLIYIFIKDFFNQSFNFEILSFVRYFIIFLFISLYSKIKTDKFNFNYNYLIIIYLLVSLDTIFQYFFGFNFFGFEKYSHDRLTSFFDNEPIVGSFLMKLILPITFYLFVEKKNIYILISFIFLGFISIIFSGERMPFLQTLFGFSIIFIFINKFNLKGITSFILIFILSILFLSSQEKVKNRYITIFNGITSLYVDLQEDLIITKENSSPHYGGIYDYYLNFQSGVLIWKENIFFGNGYRFYKNNCDDFLKNGKNLGCSTHPHNIYIEILSDHGLFGLILFLSFVIFFVFNFLKSSFNKKYYGFIIVIIVTSFPFVTSQSIFSSFYGSIFFFQFFLLRLLDFKNKD